VTISTNMAGRGVDIILGGSAQRARERDQVVAAGGLHVIGTARHESVRIDNQLRGRSGRQGDPGSSRFFLSLDDELYRRFGALAIDSLRNDLKRRNQRTGEPIRSWRVQSVLKSLQKKVDCENEAARRDVLNYDMVIHVQRETIYAWRRTLVETRGFDPHDLLEKLVDDLCARHPDRGALVAALKEHFRAPFELPGDRDPRQPALEQALSLLERREQMAGAQALNELGRRILLMTIDDLWTEHLSALERLEEGIGLRGYAQVDPLNEWRREATQMWLELLQLIRSRSVALWFLADLQSGS